MATTPESQRGAQSQPGLDTTGVVVSEMAGVNRHLPLAESRDQAAHTELLAHSREQTGGLVTFKISREVLPFRYSSMFHGGQAPKRKIKKPMPCLPPTKRVSLKMGLPR